MNTIKLPLDCTVSVNGSDSYFFTGAAYDTESTTIYDKKEIKIRGVVHEKVAVKSAFVYHVQFAIGYEYYTFRTIRDFTYFLRNLTSYIQELHTEDNKPKLIIWVCNLSHEWAFMKNYIAENFELTRIFSRSKREPLLIELDNTVQFREAIGLFGHSAADISNNWCSLYKKLKGDLDYSLIRHSLTPIQYDESGHSEYDYMKNDVMLLTEMHEKIMQAYIREDKSIYIPYTTSGFVRLHLKDAIKHDDNLTDYRENHMGKLKDNITMLKIFNKSIFTNADDWNLLRQYGFSGGVVGTNRKYVGKVLSNIVCADIESDYPYQMLDKDYPCGKIHTGTKEMWQKCLQEHKPAFGLFYVGKMTATTDHAFFSKHKIINDNDKVYNERHGGSRNRIIYNGKVVQCENAVIIMNDVDYSAYSRAYDFENLIPLKVWYFNKYIKLPIWLRKCVAQDYYNKTVIKRKYGSQKAQTMQIYRDSKSRVNTYFGTLALRPSDIFDRLDDSDNLFKPTEEFTFEELKNNCWLNPYWAFYVTSYARAMLIDAILTEPDAVVQYDTDSLYIRANIKAGERLIEHLEKANEKIKWKNGYNFKGLVNDVEFCRKLGTWDFDDTYDKFLGLGAKKYIKSDKDGIHTTIAGLPKSAISAMIKSKGISSAFKVFNPIALQHAVIVDNEYCKKLASVYNDDNFEHWEQITDYTGQTILQPVSSYHALVPIDFTFDAQNLYYSQQDQFSKIKPLK